MVYFGASAIARRRLSRSGSIAACWWPFILGVKRSSMKRWGRTIPSSVAWVIDDMVARLIDGQRARDFQVRISIENSRGQRVPCYCRETFWSHRSWHRISQRHGMRSSLMLMKMARTRLLAGLLILSDVRGSSARWFFPRLLPGVVPARCEDSEARWRLVTPSSGFYASWDVHRSVQR